MSRCLSCNVILEGNEIRSVKSDGSHEDMCVRCRTKAFTLFSVYDLPWTKDALDGSEKPSDGVYRIGEPFPTFVSKMDCGIADGGSEGPYDYKEQELLD